MIKKGNKINLLNITKEDLDSNLHKLKLFIELFDYTNGKFFIGETKLLNKKELDNINDKFLILKDYKFLKIISNRIDIVFAKTIDDKNKFRNAINKCNDNIRKFKLKEKENKKKISAEERKKYDEDLKRVSQFRENLEKCTIFSENCKPDKGSLCKKLKFLEEMLETKHYIKYKEIITDNFIKNYQKYFSGLSFLKKESNLFDIYKNIDLTKEKEDEILDLSTSIFDDILLKNRTVDIIDKKFKISKPNSLKNGYKQTLSFRNYAENFSEFLELISESDKKDSYEDFISNNDNFEVLENINNFLINFGNLSFFNEEKINYVLLKKLKEEMQGVLDYKKSKITASELRDKFNIIAEEKKENEEQISKKKEIAKKFWKKIPLKGLLLISLMLSIIFFLAMNSLTGFLFVSKTVGRGNNLANNPFLAILPGYKKIYFATVPMAFGFGAAIFPIIWYFYYVFKRRNYLIGKEHGSAKWMDSETLAKLIEAENVTYKNNMIFGKEIGMSLNDRKTRRNNNILIFGGSGTGKTRFEVKPNLLQAHSNYVVTDPKGDLLHETGYFFEKEGYRIRVLNLIDMEKSDKYNFFEYLPDNQPDRIQSEIEKLVTNIMKNAGNNEGGKTAPKDEFWDNATSLLLSAIFYYVKVHVKNPAEQNLSKVAELLLKANPDQSNKAELDEIFKEIETKYGTNEPSVKLYKSYKLAGEKTLQSINISAVTKLSKFFIKEVQDLTTSDEINIREFANPNSKMILYVIISDTDTSFNFLVAMLYQQLFDVLFEEARKHGGRLSVPLRMLLDEFANIGRIPNFESIISVVRSRNISVAPIFQSLAQVKNSYDKAADIILDNCDTWIFLGGQSTDTTKEMSGKIGKTTIDLSIGNRTFSKESSYSESNSLIQRDLMMSDELSKMDDNDLIVLIRGYDPYKGPKFILEEHPNYHFLEDANKNLNYAPPKSRKTGKISIELRDYIMQQYRERPILSRNISPKEILQQRDEFIDAYESLTESDKKMIKMDINVSESARQFTRIQSIEKEKNEYEEDRKEFWKEKIDVSELNISDLDIDIDDEKEKIITEEKELGIYSEEDNKKDMEESADMVGEIDQEETNELSGDLDGEELF